MRHAATAVLLLGGIAYASGAQVLSLRTRIDLPNVNGRIDHLAADAQGERVFLAALGNNTIEVLDVRNGKRVNTIRDIPEPQGLFFHAQTNRLFIACGKDGTARVFDARGLQPVASVKFSGDADNIRYDARTRRIVVGYGEGALGLIDSNGRKLGEIPMDAHPESFQLERAGTRVFVNVPDRKEIEVADLDKRTILSKWPVTSALKNYPMALDETHHRLLVGCREPARMLVYDTESGKQTASVEIVGDTDDLFYDASTSRVYVIGGQGFVDVFRQTDADHYERLERVGTARGARTGLFVPQWGRLFVAVPHRGEQRAQLLVYDTK